MINDNTEWNNALSSSSSSYPFPPLFLFYWFLPHDCTFLYRFPPRLSTVHLPTYIHRHIFPSTNIIHVILSSFLNQHYFIAVTGALNSYIKDKIRSCPIPKGTTFFLAWYDTCGSQHYVWLISRHLSQRCLVNLSRTTPCFSLQENVFIYSPSSRSLRCLFSRYTWSLVILLHVWSLLLSLRPRWCTGSTCASHYLWWW